MGKIVSINAGSTSIKMAIYDDFAIQDGQTTPLAEYRWEKDVKKATVKFGVHKYVHDVPFESHTEAFKDGINRFKRAESFKYSNEIITVVNRAVNGGELLQSPDPIEITTEVQKEFERNIDLAPNHNPPALEVSKAAQKLFYGAKHYYMFDTGWHSTMPIMNQLYALPKECFEKVGIRAFGAHGIVYMDNTKRAAQKLNISEDKVNLILLHLGGGCSANAVKNGKSIDTTMGYTPIDGLMMATRCGHIDPGVFPKLVEYYGSVKKVMEVMTKSLASMDSLEKLTCVWSKSWPKKVMKWQMLPLRDSSMKFAKSLEHIWLNSIMKSMLLCVPEVSRKMIRKSSVEFLKDMRMWDFLCPRILQRSQMRNVAIFL